MSNCHTKRSLSCQIDRLLNIHKSSIKRLSRSKTCREIGSADRSFHRSAIPGAAARRPSPAGGSAASHDPKGRPAMARRCGRGLRGGRGRRYAPGEVATLPPTARPCRAAGDGGRAAWPLGTAGAPKAARAAAARTGAQRAASGTGGHQRQTRRPVVLFHVEQLYAIPCCRTMFYNIKS